MWSNFVQPDSVSRGLEKFAIECFKTLSKNEKGNFIFSPISLSMVLSMLMLGARENTKRQLNAILHMTQDDAINEDGLESLVRVLTASRQHVDLRLANKIFVPQNFPVLPAFQDLMQKIFQAPLENIDFQNVSQACAIINNWCAQNTNYRINNIIDASAITDTTMILVNAVYFKGDWEEKFNSKNTQPEPFYLNQNTMKNVPMMRQTANYNFGYIGNKARYIELPYKSDGFAKDLSMFVILPEPSINLSDIENDLQTVDFQNFHAQFNSRKINLHLPKFRIESQFNLSGTLNAMGLTDIFIPYVADFQPIANIPPITPLYVTKIMQKAFIEVNEEGSEAAAVTYVGGGYGCAAPRPTPIIDFIVDRPFICSIVAVKKGIQLFSARIMDPTAA